VTHGHFCPGEENIAGGPLHTPLLVANSPSSGTTQSEKQETGLRLNSCKQHSMLLCLLACYTHTHRPIPLTQHTLLLVGFSLMSQPRLSPKSPSSGTGQAENHSIYLHINTRNNTTGSPDCTHAMPMIRAPYDYEM